MSDYDPEILREFVGPDGDPEELKAKLNRARAEGQSLIDYENDPRLGVAPEDVPINPTLGEGIDMGEFANDAYKGLQQPHEPLSGLQADAKLIELTGEIGIDLPIGE